MEHYRPPKLLAKEWEHEKTRRKLWADVCVCLVHKSKPSAGPISIAITSANAALKAFDEQFKSVADEDEDEL